MHMSPQNLKVFFLDNKERPVSVLVFILMKTSPDTSLFKGPFPTSPGWTTLPLPSLTLPGSSCCHPLLPLPPLHAVPLTQWTPIFSGS